MTEDEHAQVMERAAAFIEQKINKLETDRQILLDTLADIACPDDGVNECEWMMKKAMQAIEKVSK